MRRRSGAVTGSPSIVTEPLPGARKPPAMFSSVDLPHPRDLSSRRYLELRDSIFEEIGLAHKI